MKWKESVNLRALADHRFALKGPSHGTGAFAHTHQPEAISLDPLRRAHEIKADAVIAHDQVKRISGLVQFDRYFTRLGMAQNVSQCLEGNSETGRLHFRIRTLQVLIS